MALLWIMSTLLYDSLMDGSLENAQTIFYEAAVALDRPDAAPCDGPMLIDSSTLLGDLSPRRHADDSSLLHQCWRQAMVLDAGLEQR